MQTIDQVVGGKQAWVRADIERDDSEYVGLLYVRPAKTGGISQVISFYTLHNEPMVP